MPVSQNIAHASTSTATCLSQEPSAGTVDWHRSCPLLHKSTMHLLLNTRCIVDKQFLFLSFFWSFPFSSFLFFSLLLFSLFVSKMFCTGALVRFRLATTRERPLPRLTPASVRLGLWSVLDNYFSFKCTLFGRNMGFFFC